jgi:uncharacterized integral membrane protein
MNNLLKFLITIVLLLIALAFFAFSIQNNVNVSVTIMPECIIDVPLYMLVLLCLFTGFLSAIVITRFEYIKAKFNFKLFFRKIFSKKQSKSKYVSE